MDPDQSQNSPRRFSEMGQQKTMQSAAEDNNALAQSLSVDTQESQSTSMNRRRSMAAVMTRAATTGSDTPQISNQPLSAPPMKLAPKPDINQIKMVVKEQQQQQQLQQQQQQRQRQSIDQGTSNEQLDKLASTYQSKVSLSDQPGTIAPKSDAVTGSHQDLLSRAYGAGKIGAGQSKTTTFGFPKSSVQKIAERFEESSPSSNNLSTSNNSFSLRKSADNLARGIEKVIHGAQDTKAKPVVAANGNSSVHDKKSQLNTLNVAALSPVDNPDDKSPGARARRKSFLLMQQQEQQESKDVVAEGNNGKKPSLTRSKAVNNKKRNSTSRRAETNLAMASYGRRKLSTSITQIGQSLKQQSGPVDRVQGLYRLYRIIAMIADEICMVYDSWSYAVTDLYKLILHDKPNVDRDSSNNGSEEFPFDYCMIVVKDFLSAANEIAVTLGENPNNDVKALKRAIIDAEACLKQDQILDKIPAKDRENEAKKSAQKARKACTGVISASLSCIAAFLKSGQMLPILSVAGWKIEAVSLLAMPAWLQLYGMESHELDKEKALDFDEGSLREHFHDRLVRSQSLFGKVKNEVFLNAKPQYIISKSMSSMLNSSRNRHFSSQSKMDINEDGVNLYPIEYFDVDALAYRCYFQGTDHRNYIGMTERFGEVAISVKRELLVKQDDSQQSPLTQFDQKLNGNDFTVTSGQGSYYFRVLFRCKNYLGQLTHLLIPESDLPTASRLNIFGSKKDDDQKEKGASERMYKALFSMIHPKLDMSKLRRFDVDMDSYDDRCQKLEKALVQLDEHKTAFNYKFGLLYVVDGQSNESEWFNNVKVSDSYLSFCSILGETISLKGHQGFAGGLDTRNGNTGEKSIYTKWRFNPVGQAPLPLLGDGEEPFNCEDDITFEIMYHVSTLLPFTPGDEQQIQRKRHIGNDLVSLVFLDSSQGDTASANDWFVKTPFDPKQIKSQFLHVYIVVQEVKVDPSIVQVLKPGLSSDSLNCVGYRVYATSNIEVPNYQPSLCDPPVYLIQNDDDKKQFGDFLIAKLISAENAAFEASKFKTLHNRTYTGLMEQLLRDFNDEVKGKISARPSMRKNSVMEASTVSSSATKDSLQGKKSVSTTDSQEDGGQSAASKRQSLIRDKEEQNSADVKEQQSPSGNIGLFGRHFSSVRKSAAVMPQEEASKKSGNQIADSGADLASGEQNKGSVLQPQITVDAIDDDIKAVSVAKDEQKTFVPVMLKINDQTPATSYGSDINIVSNGQEVSDISVQEANAGQSPDQQIAATTRVSLSSDKIESNAHSNETLEKASPSSVRVNSTQASSQEIKNTGSAEDVDDLQQWHSERVRTQSSPAMLRLRPRIDSGKNRLSSTRLADSDEEDDEEDAKLKKRENTQSFLDFLNSGPPEELLNVGNATNAQATKSRNSLLRAFKKKSEDNTDSGLSPQHSRKSQSSSYVALPGSAGRSANHLPKAPPVSQPGSSVVNTEGDVSNQEVGLEDILGLDPSVELSYKS
ncbi:hypothetical protein MP228_003664 [Amoeboaphelidium protococcarum]|nr:hypothetical protein MP228_003664 [Amoeboaphelidium protococcarum]